jgi:putative transcriptional regulator
MTTKHHPDDATLVSYAAGSLPAAFELLVTHHSDTCQQCCQRIDEAEQLGMAMVEGISPVPTIRRKQFANLLEQQPLANTDQTPDMLCRSHHLPTPLQILLNQGKQSLPWQRLVPGIQKLELDDNLKLIKIEPGISIPMHSHCGNEMTLILRGSYSDELGHFQPNDLVDLNGDIEHQPIADGHEACICLVALDAPLKFRNLLPRLLQPYIGF